MAVRRALTLAALLVAVPWAAHTTAQQSLLATPVHLGVAGQPEWDHFAGRTPTGRALSLDFTSSANTSEHTLLIRQSDVKQLWTVTLNGARLGALVAMEADLVHALPVPAGALRDGANTLRIDAKTADDIVLHRIDLRPIASRALLDAAHLELDVRDERGVPLPARLTVLDEQGFLAAMQGESPPGRLAVRPGVAYAADTRVRLGLLPGTYRVRATRGPEYSADDVTLTVAAGETARARLVIRREVPTVGWAAMDTHVHTLALSGHGDATLDERALTLAGEGVELAVATEHNRVADYAQALQAMDVARFVTPISGNEVTTPRGHFNLVPASDEAWAILNHAHDVHSDFTPFAPPHFNPATGLARQLTREFQAMEIVNSGAMRTDWMEPIRSWLALLARRRSLTPIGASDSHDVSRFIVGQGRTYVQVDDRDPGRIDVAAATDALRHGRVVVSLGLFADVSIDGVGPGGIVHTRGVGARSRRVEDDRPPRPHTVRARVFGPSWIDADRVALYVNGEKVREQRLTPTSARQPLKADLAWTLPVRQHDAHVVVIASGPGVTHPSWAIARPYQPSTTTVAPVVLSVSGPIRVDADGDHTYSSAWDYAARITDTHATSRDVLDALATHDEVVAAMVAERLEARGEDLQSPAMRKVLAAAPLPVRRGVERYLAAK